MKNKIYRNRIIASAILLVFSVQGINAQDTIDTAYYRYSIHHTGHFGHPFAFYDTLTGQYPIDPVTGDYISVCPNGEGFVSLYSHNCTYTIGNHFYYAHYDLGAPETDLYGIALFLKNVEDFTVGDSIVATLYKWPDNTNPPIPIDSIVINGGNIGKRRWMEMPLLQSGAVDDYFQLTQSFSSTIHDDCIGSVDYLPIMEFYFDTVRHISSDSLWYMIRDYRSHGSQFIVYSVNTISYYGLVYRMIYDWRYNELYTVYWHGCFPITAPLPDWEVSSLDTLIPIPTKPENPDPGDPQNPDNPSNPDDPQNPDDPDDPDNPGGDEGIGEADGVPVFDIRPNPTSGVTTVSCAEAISELTVRDMAGRVVLRKAACGATATFDTSTLRKGVYLVKVTTTRGTVTKKLVVE